MAFGNITFWLLKKTNYDSFAEDFSASREHPWQEAELFRDLLRKQHYRMGGHEKLLVLDAGCGNGRHIPELEKGGAEVVGIDQSEKLIECARKKYSGRTLLVGDMRQLPFPDASFDAVFAFASLPHLPTKHARKQALSEIIRVLRPGGLFGGTAWNLNQERFRQARKRAIWRRFFLPWWSKKDVVIPWGNKKIPRLYHAFSAEDIQILLAQTGFEDGECTKPGATDHNLVFFGYRPKRISVLGVPFDVLDFASALHALHEYSRGKRQIFVTTPNPEMCIAADNDEDFLRILQSAHLSVADGAGILWASDFLQQQTKTLSTKNVHSWKTMWSLLTFFWKRTSFLLPERIAGSDLFNAFCKSTREPVFLLGGAPGSARECSRIFAGTIAGYDAGSSAPEDEERIRRAINASRATVLFVAFGAPAQEKWIARNLQFLPHIRLAMGVGGSFDFTAGKQIRAPKIFQSLRLEWLWRLLREPKKRGKRIWNAIAIFPNRIRKPKKNGLHL